MEIGQSKMPTSRSSQCTHFPDLNTGNNTYKAVQKLRIGYRSMLQGLNKPVNDLSRGCTADDIINTVVITAIQDARVVAHHLKLETF
jgi:phosphate acetyltransferase